MLNQRCAHFTTGHVSTSARPAAKLVKPQRGGHRTKVLCSQEKPQPAIIRRRAAIQSAALVTSLSAVPLPSEATPARRKKQSIDPALYKDIPGTDPPIKYYDIKGGAGTEGGAAKGQRVAVHFDVKWKSLTIATSRQGAGVTGGVPYGYNVGIQPGTPGGPFIEAFNQGIRGMGVGTVRTLLVPPEYAYGNRQVQEIPPNATLQLDLELLSIKKDNPLGK
ncbi:hypothetical protein CYMTET_24781 [Cymbomonas tetramitiformis]|uniref:peptidylprolyl isomerase n=1 Tax=Cymbomonas tetramitiformis TaxID=36881 RepID=A0AAE0FVP6_9CHLO|nr:hypothetical protein CYMTET_24781 [Cymbomonas tetramitiformis]